MTITAEPIVTGDLVHVDPARLIIGANVRLTKSIDGDFLASIKERGVLVPISAYLADDGDDINRLVVEHGQRRTLAAVEAGLELVPVWVVDAPADAERVVDQLTENEHRAPITTADQVAAYEQLHAFGLPAGEIAKRTATTPERVATGLRVAGSAVAVGTVAQHPEMTLDQALVFAEFEEDKDAIGALVACITEPDDNEPFAHVAAQLRDDRAEFEAKQALEAELAAAGIKIVERPAWDSKTTKGLDSLKHGKKNLTVPDHADCPGHAAYIAMRHNWVDGRSSSSPEAFYVCTDWRKHGHKDRYAAAGTASSGSTDDGVGEPDEKASAERKRVIAGNKAWRAATKVRRAWLADFSQHKDAGDLDVERFIATTISRGDHVLTRAFGNAHKFLYELLDSEQRGADRPLRDEIATATKSRALVITTTLLLAAWEADAHDPFTWRRVDRSSTDSAHFLGAMAAAGYELASIEQALVDGKAWKVPTS